MTESYIGFWGVRPGGRWHLVESEVTDRLVMRCGRQMRMVLEPSSGGAMSFQMEPTGERCEMCTGHRVRD